MIISIAVFLVILVSVIVLVVSIRRKKNGKAPDPGIKSGGSQTGEYNGIPYKYKYFGGAQNSPPSFSISIDCDKAGDFKITRESKFDRFFKRIGIAIEMETHDPEFDDRYYVSSNSPRFTEHFLARSEIRSAIDTLFGRGFTQIRKKNKKLELLWIPYRTKTPVQDREIESLVEKLTILFDRIQKIEIPSYESEKRSWKTRRLIAFLVPSFLILGGILSLIFGIINYPPLDKGKLFLHSLKISLPLLILFIWISVKLLKGRSTSHRELMIVFLLALPAFPLGIFGGKVFLNGWMDQSTPEIHNVRVIRKFWTKSKNSKTYYIRMNSWRQGRGSEKISVSFREYNRIIPGRSDIAITTMDGKFGYEWIVGYSIE